MRIVVTTKQPSTLAAVSYYVDDGQGGMTMINDVDPGYDVCSSLDDQVMMTGKNIGDLLNAAHVTWGGFMGGFDLATKNANGTTNCRRSTHSATVGITSSTTSRTTIGSSITLRRRIRRTPARARSRRSAIASSPTARRRSPRTTSTTCRTSTTR